MSAEKARQEDQLATLWEKEGRPGPGTTSLQWARGKVVPGIDELRKQAESLDQLVLHLDSALRARGDYLAARKSELEAKTELARRIQEIQAAPALRPESAILLIEVLTKTRHYIEAEIALD